MNLLLKLSRQKINTIVKRVMYSTRLEAWISGGYFYAEFFLGYVYQAALHYCFFEDFPAEQWL